MTRLLEKPGSPARTDTIAAPLKGKAKTARLSVPVRLARNLLRRALLGLRRLRPGPGVLRRHGRVRCGLVLAPDLRSFPGAAASVDGPRGFRRPAAWSLRLLPLGAPVPDRRAIRFRQRRRAGGGRCTR